MNKLTKKILGKSGTFTLNKNEAIHRWYPYIEGYSSCLIDNQLDSLSDENILTVYDPFGGTGTTLLVASQRGIKPYYSESNPFMRIVIEAKINAVNNLIKRNIGAKSILEFKTIIEETAFVNETGILQWDGFECFFDNKNLSNLLQIKKYISTINDEDTRQLLMLALSSISVPVSKMIRRGDLRYAKEGEKDFSTIDVKSLYLQKLAEMTKDIDSVGSKILFQATELSADARDIKGNNLIDCVITSPPYLNGTNYIRNTKLELKLNGFITSASDLPIFHSKGIIAGINNVSKRNNHVKVLDEVRPYIDQLSPVAYDSRIPTMVAGYFYDMNKVIDKLHNAIKDGGIFVMDIGDSQFAGIHIPTPDILSDLCKSHGFEKFDESILRQRRSKNGMALSQRLMKFKLRK